LSSHTDAGTEPERLRLCKVSSVTAPPEAAHLMPFQSQWLATMAGFHEAIELRRIAPFVLDSEQHFAVAGGGRFGAALATEGEEQDDDEEGEVAGVRSRHYFWAASFGCWGPVSG